MCRRNKVENLAVKAKRLKCDGRSTPDRWRLWRPRRVYAGRGEERRSLRFRDHLTGAEATAARSLQFVLPEGKRLWQCGNGRWHELPVGTPLVKMCEWGLMEYYDAREAHEAARRIRYRIPHCWEWLAIAGVLCSSALSEGLAWALANLLR